MLGDLFVMNSGVMDIFILYFNGLLNVEVSQFENLLRLIQSWEDFWVYILLKDVLDFVKVDDNMIINNGNMFCVFLLNKFIILVNVDNVVKFGIVVVKDKEQCVKDVCIEFSVFGFMKEQVMMLDFIVNNNWKCVVYYFLFVGQEVVMVLLQSGYFVIDGMVWEVILICNLEGLNVECMYYNLMEVYDYGDMKNGVLIDNYVCDQIGLMCG